MSKLKGTKNPAIARMQAVLSGWAAIEVLAPPERFRDYREMAGKLRAKVFPVTRAAPLPWAGNPPPAELGRHQVIVCSMRAGLAEKEMGAALGLSPEFDRRPRRDVVPVATFDVGWNGQVTAETRVTVSSFPWAVGKVLAGRLDDLQGWREVEDAIGADLAEMLPVGRMVEVADIEDLRDAVLRWLALPERFLQTDCHVVTHPLSPAIRPGKREPPQQRAVSGLIMNSPYLSEFTIASDLVERAGPDLVSRYLGEGGIRPMDLTNDRDAVGRIIGIDRHPAAKWPAGAERSLNTMQQAAANAILGGSGNEADLVAVNGPPGTGKTTLLSDVIAAVVVRRAQAMTTYQTPESAFTSAQDGETFDIAPDIAGHEIVVASSNNAAVENISKELPTIRAVPGMPEMRHFPSAANYVPADDTGPARQAAESMWGTIAVVAGNASNRAAMARRLWWDADHSIRQSLNYARYGRAVVKERSQGGNDIEREARCVAVDNPPCGPAACAARWEAAVARFNLAHREVERFKIATASLPDLRLRLAEQKKASEADAVTLGELRKQSETAKRQLASLQAEIRTNKASAAAAVEMLASFQATSPGRIARTLRLRVARDHEDGVASRRREIERMAAIREQKILAARELMRKISDIDAQIGTAAQRQREQLADIADLDGEIEMLAPYEIASTVDNAYLDQSHEIFHVASPWASPAFDRCREELFAAAMEVHTAFAYAAAKPILKNLRVFAQGIGGAEKYDLGDERSAWRTVFLLCPAVSTTFASFGGLFRSFGPEGLGYLMIDEAGQSTPQSAIGAIMRARRVGIVGDPLQLEPISPLDVNVARKVFARFDPRGGRFLAPSASVQTLADAASTYGGTFGDGSTARRTGIPLLVHRRCSEPMFSFANRIAYAGQMVSRKAPRPAGIRPATPGGSRWINVTGAPATGRVNPAEIEEARRLLRGMLVAARGGPEPSIFILAPFRDVAREIFLMAREEATAAGLPAQEAAEFAARRVGTLHVSQGREADCVAIVLGVASEGAMTWASSRPNMLNVAATRAREALIVIGDRARWREHGFFRDLDAALPGAAAPRKRYDGEQPQPGPQPVLPSAVHGVSGACGGIHHWPP